MLVPFGTVPGVPLDSVASWWVVGSAVVLGCLALVVIGRVVRRASHLNQYRFYTR